MLINPFVGSAVSYNSLPVLDGVDYLESRVETDSGPVLPNVHEWQAGDVVLYTTAGKKEWLSGNPIRAYQSAAGFAAIPASIVHVGVYVGRNTIWEATPKLDVHPSYIRDALHGGRVFGLVRCSVGHIDETKLLRAIADIAHKRYLMLDLAPSLAARFLGIAVQPTDQKYVICSLFVQNVLSIALGYPLLAEFLVSVPGDFASSAEFTPVPLYWCRPDLKR